MMYVDFSAGNKEYKLRLTTKNIMTLEKSLGCNPIMIFGTGNTIPSVTAMVQVLHASLQHLNHNITFNDASEIFDAYIADGHSMTDFIPVIVEVYKASGLIRADEENVEKN